MTFLPLLLLAIVGDPVVIDTAPPHDVVVYVDAVPRIVRTVQPPLPGPSPRPDPPAPTPTPTPDPAPPAPDPAPTPTPKPTGPLHVSLVLDLDTITPELARLREATQAREYFSTAQVNYRTYAATSPDVARLKLTPYLKPGDQTPLGVAVVPTVLIQDQTGKVLWSGRAPPDEAGLIAKVKEYR